MAMRHTRRLKTEKSTRLCVGRGRRKFTSLFDICYFLVAFFAYMQNSETKKPRTDMDVSLAVVLVSAPPRWRMDRALESQSEIKAGIGIEMQHKRSIF